MEEGGFPKPQIWRELGKFSILLDVSTINQPTRQHAKRPRPAHPTRRAKLPWIRCLHCGRKLAQFDVIDGHTCVRVGGTPATFIKLLCVCGATRCFKAI